jgi:anti-sigma factor RsiW
MSDEPERTAAAKTPDDQQRLWRFLLGEASEEERSAIEEQLFLAQGQLAAIEVAEDELIDAYARGELSSEQRQRFEERYLRSDRQRARVAFAGALASAATQAKRVPVSPRRWLRPSLWQAAAAAVVVAALATLGARLLGARHDLVIDQTLAPMMLRGEIEPATMQLPAQMSRLQLHLVIDEPLPQDCSVEVVLRHAGDAPRTLPARYSAGTITVVVDAKDIASGTYELTAAVRRGSALEDLAVYPFRVVLR